MERVDVIDDVDVLRVGMDAKGKFSEDVGGAVNRSWLNVIEMNLGGGGGELSRGRGKEGCMDDGSEEEKEDCTQTQTGDPVVSDHGERRKPIRS